MGAAYNSQERDPAPRRLPGTRTVVLEETTTWADAGSDNESIFWVRGPAGAGKSAIAQTVAEICAGNKTLAASFFCARSVGGRNSAGQPFPTIAVQIALLAPGKRRTLDSILKKDSLITERTSGSVDLLALLFQNRSGPAATSQFLVIVDGLDECQGHDEQSYPDTNRLHGQYPPSPSPLLDHEPPRGASL